MIKLSDLRERDIVNVADGRRIGVVGDLEIDPDTGRITAMVVPGAARLFGLLGSEGDCHIPWDDIVTIGEDVILVRHGGAGGGGHGYGGPDGRERR